MSEVKKIQKTVDLYEVYGKTFMTESEAKEYASKIEKLMNYTYFDVKYSPDLTEGRGWGNCARFAVEGGIYSLLHYLMSNVGKPLEFVMGVAPIQNYVFDFNGKTFDSPKDLSTYLNSKMSKGIGDYRRSVIPDLFVINSHGELDESKTEIFKGLEDSHEQRDK